MLSVSTFAFCATQEESMADPAPPEPGYRFGDFELLPGRMILLLRGQRVKVSKRALNILKILIEHRSRAVSKDELLLLGFPGVTVEEQNIVVHISALRRILGQSVIKTIPGLGYHFVAGIEPRDGAASGPDGRQDAGGGDPRPLQTDAGSLSICETELIGRTLELAELFDIMADSRLVTLTGPGGIGKTRLAIEIGLLTRNIFGRDTWLVDLAPLTSAALVETTAAGVLNVELGRSQTAFEAMAAALTGKDALLIFDNCEHLAAPVAALVVELLNRLPELSVLVTCQEVLGVAAEAVYRLEPLVLPPTVAPDDTPVSVEEIRRFDAIKLFVARAQAVDRRFRLQADNAAAIVAICRGLEGVPLALEMAAGRLSLLGVEGLSARLGERLKLLVGRPRLGRSRYASLHAMVECSHALLDAGDRRVFRRLAVFRGSFSLEAAMSVAAEAGVAGWDTVDALGRLIDKSLVRVEGGKSPRYRLLETLRLYAAEQAVLRGESALIAARQARYFRDLFDQADLAWENVADAEWLERFGPEIDNARAALDWALATPEQGEIAVALAASLTPLWYVAGRFEEGRRYVEQTLKLIDETARPAEAARLLRRNGDLWRSTSSLTALGWLERAATLYRKLDDRLSLASVMGAIGGCCAFLGCNDQAAAALAEALPVLATGERPKSLYNVRNNLGILAGLTNDNDRAEASFGKALEQARVLKDVLRESNVLGNLAEVAEARGDVDEAINRAGEALRRARLVGRRSFLARALLNLASYQLLDGRLAPARPPALEALALAGRDGRFPARLSLQQWALIGAMEGRFAAAAQLLGFVDAAFAGARETRQPTEQRLADRAMTLIAGALAPHECDVAARSGAGWTEPQALAFAFDHLVPSP
jgi:predicted ATPase/DNA-binding winged helix-turn-helix (wHTH) protein